MRTPRRAYGSFRGHGSFTADDLRPMLEAGATPGDLLKVVGVTQTSLARQLHCSFNLIHMVANRVPGYRGGKPRPNPTRSERIEAAITDAINDRLARGRLDPEELFPPADR